MKTNLFLTSLILFVLPILVMGQETYNQKDESRFSVFAESPLFFSSFVDDYTIYTVNLEYVLSTKNKTYISFGYGRIFSANNWPSSDMVLTTEFNKLIGSKNHLFEIGGGLSYLSTNIMTNFRLGYRGVFWKRLLVRIAYTPGFLIFAGNDIIGPIDNILSVSLGYRFNIHISKEKWDKNVSWLASMQLNWQPFFKSYKAINGFYGTVNLEFLLAKFEKTTLNATAGFGYATSRSYNGRFSYNAIPVSVSAQYGKDKHFAETGIRLTLIPIGGNRDGNFYMLQPELGYRIHPGKHFMARIAYTPYWWLSYSEGKEHIEKSFVNSATIGVGWRFH